MRRPVLAAATFAALLFSGCPGDDEGCSTSQDCADQGLNARVCVSGACVIACERDSDCKEPDQPADQITMVCENLTCVDACSASSCGAEGSCISGRCARYFESFEGAESGDFVTLESRGFNDIERELRNKSAVIVWTGPPTCDASAPPDRCAGPAAHGEYYLAIEREKTPAMGTPEFGVTCGACRCCLECRDPAARASGQTSCLGVNFPNVPMCSAAVPASCQAICDSCNNCPASMPGSFGRGLNECENAAAAHQCQGCQAYDQCVAQKYAENRACPGGTYPSCQTAPTNREECNECLVAECANLREPCWACRDAQSLKRDFPNEPQRWQPLEMACMNQAANGCYSAPINIQRSELTEAEQSLESGEINLAGAEGVLVLELSYVPFNIQRQYRRVIQGQDRDTWPLETQEVAIQFCAANCSENSSWIDVAKIPAEAERQNSLPFAEQARLDWRISKAEVAIGDQFKTATFRYRFVPRLEDDARIGVDSVTIRSKK